MMVMVLVRLGTRLVRGMYLVFVGINRVLTWYQERVFYRWISYLRDKKCIPGLNGNKGLILLHDPGHDDSITRFLTTCKYFSESVGSWNCGSMVKSCAYLANTHALSDVHCSRAGNWRSNERRNNKRISREKKRKKRFTSKLLWIAEFVMMLVTFS